MEFSTKRSHSLTESRPLSVSTSPTALPAAKAAKVSSAENPSTGLTSNRHTSDLEVDSLLVSSLTADSEQVSIYGSTEDILVMSGGKGLLTCPAEEGLVAYTAELLAAASLSASVFD